jgi:hypothetical protein
MKCPHCLTAFHDNWTAIPIETDADGSWMLSHATCPQCKRLIIRLVNGTGVAVPRTSALVGLVTAHKVLVVHPKGASRSPCPNEVPDQISGDYKEACLVLDDSPKASAALSGTCRCQRVRGLIVCQKAFRRAHEYV